MDNPAYTPAAMRPNPRISLPEVMWLLKLNAALVPLVLFVPLVALSAPALPVPLMVTLLPVTVVSKAAEAEETADEATLDASPTTELAAEEAMDSTAPAIPPSVWKAFRKRCDVNKNLPHNQVCAETYGRCSRCGAALGASRCRSVLCGTKNQPSGYKSVMIADAELTEELAMDS